MTIMFRATIFAILTALGYVLTSSSAHAQDTNLPSGFTSWSNYDTASYMVSTLNLVRLENGEQLPLVLIQNYGVTRYAVWQDLYTGTYVIQFKRATGVNAGMVVNRLGWQSPTSYSRLTDALGMIRSQPPVERHFRTHPKQLLGSLAAERPL